MAFAYNQETSRGSLPDLLGRKQSEFNNRAVHILFFRAVETIGKNRASAQLRWCIPGKVIVDPGPEAGKKKERDGQGRSRRRELAVVRVCLT